VWSVQTFFGGAFASIAVLLGPLLLVARHLGAAEASDGVAWQPELWSGLIVMAGLFGVGLVRLAGPAESAVGVG
jgi:hypothetical protein